MTQGATVETTGATEVKLSGPAFDIHRNKDYWKLSYLDHYTRQVIDSQVYSSQETAKRAYLVARATILNAGGL